MSAATIAALSSGVVGVITAVTALIKVITHTHHPPDGSSKP